MALTPLQRVLDNDYADGLSLPRISKFGAELPSTRFVSTTTRFNRINEDPEFTSMLVAFGQYLDHDLDHVPISSKLIFKSLILIFINCGINLTALRPIFVLYINIDKDSCYSMMLPI
jgi:hypothetical protein